jgi:CDP-diacylglycerol--glycerol-3-phosphate 3-phosphatidyltransferase
MNLPNSITISRIATVPLLIWILSPAFPANHATHGLLGGEQELIASTVFILASITDGLDGYLARKRKQITTLGMLLDPLADKLMVTAAYIILVAYTPRIVPPWIAVIIIGREFLVSGLRSIAASEGFTIEASEIGKLKTVIQIVSVVAAILAHRWNYWLWFPSKDGGGFVIAVHMIAMWAIYWMTIVSIISATDYASLSASLARFISFRAFSSDFALVYAPAMDIQSANTPARDTTKPQITTITTVPLVLRQQSLANFRPL